MRYIYIYIQIFSVDQERTTNLFIHNEKVHVWFDVNDLFFEALALLSMKTQSVKW